jgi:hypothetical protein
MAQTLANDGSTNLNSTGSGIKLRANSSGVPMSHDDVDTNFENLRTKINEVIGEVGTNTTKLSGIATGANNYSLPLATSTVRGGIELFSNADQSVAANSVTTTAGRTYGIQLNTANQAVVNVPWSNTTYSAASSSSLGLSKLGSNTTQGTAANSVTTTANRTYAVQHNSADQLVVNVPWSNTTYSAATSSTAGLVKIGYTENGKNYPVELSSGKMYVNVPWVNTDTNTTYTAGTGITISGTTISATGGAGASYDAAYEGGGVFGRTIARMGVGYDASAGANLIRRDSEAALTASATDFAPFGATSIASDDNLYVVNGQKTMRIYIHASEGIDISKDSDGNTIADGYGNNNTQGGLSSYSFRGVVADPIDSRYDTIPQFFINYGQAKAYLQFYHLGISSVEFAFLTDVTEELYPYGSGTAPHDGHYFKEKLYSPFQNGERGVKQWNITFKGGRTFLHYATENIHIQDLSLNISAPDGFSHVSVVTGGSYLYLAGYVGVYVDRWAEIGIWAASRQSIIYDFSMGDYRIGNTGSNPTSVFPTYLYAADASIVKDITSYAASPIYNHGAYSKRFDGNWGTCKLANSSTFTLNTFNIPHTGSADHSSVMGWPDGNNIGPVSKTMSSGGSPERVHTALGPYTQVTGTRQTFDPLTKAYQIPAFLSYGVGNVAGYNNITEFSGSTIEMEPISLNRYCFSPVMGDYAWGSTFNAGITDAFQSLLQTSQNSAANFPITIVNPIHSSNGSTTGAKGRSFHFYKHGYASGDAFNSSTNDETSSHATNANGDSFNRYFPTTANFHAQDVSWIPTANFA